ncbi:hypothetical protein TVAG_039940 [Trichomonas vaginalis G3]|uniref:Uncharacterized protein n=1 Tax=Trichomonas vaginalis (strain ATCC PRA-98 / G3) TaxID=412133 RepID=A2EQW8_TRIV3|nr:spectrin binding [Trichomonas vaginalis G3]EAY04942.1 hypothetical protein TVAG_039940 [Trichomonas vaginalis G3]KAI5508774.1 spectrin binding [Trichomonas vaginalis G3]|eukprot:XP_001317165.1 hypothetical protein [Trichomonas vaginalis G3]
MNMITKKYLVIEWGNDIKGKEPFSFIVNDEKIESYKHISIMISKTVHDQYLRDSSIKSVTTYLNLLCNNTIDIISEFFKTGALRFENDCLHNRDIFEVGKAFGIEFLTDIFCAFVNSTYKEINKENFYDIYDCATTKNDTNKINECISFFASRMFDFQEDYKIITFKRYGYDFFERVLTSKSLKVSNEDSVVSTIISMSEIDNSFFPLLNHVRVEFCNNNSITSIKNHSIKHSLESISTEVFERALLHRSLIPHKLQISNANYFSRESIPNPFKNSKIEEYHCLDHSDENMRKLMSLSKTKDNFGKIFKILEKASSEADIATIKLAIDEKYSDVQGKFNRNMILEAARKNNLNLVQHLFNHGADIRSRSSTKRTILHFFCQEGNLEAVKFALNFIDINDVNNGNETPLHDAIYNNRANICEYLSSQTNINKNIKTNANETALQLTIRLKQQQCVDILRRNGFTE